MPPQLALLLYFILLMCLLMIDAKRKSEVSGAIWIPLIWVLIIGSKLVSQWFGFGYGTGSPTDYEKGNPMDRVVFTILFIIAAVILFQKKISWAQIVKSNGWILMDIKENIKYQIKEI